MVSQVFYPKKADKKPGYTILNLCRHVSPTEGEIGIEIEVEGTNIPRTDESPLGSFSPSLIPKKWWTFHHDGSLRGEENAEYVLKKPIKFSEVPEAIGELWTMFEKAGSVLDDSNRTSVHVHLNGQSFYLNRLCSFFALYFLVEELLTAWCGDHRIGNLFCLRAKDAPAIVSKIKGFLQDGESYSYLSEGLHYAGVNANALITLGSIEIRSLRGVTDPSVILDWVTVLERIYKLSADYPDPRAICEGFSGNGPLAFFEMILGPTASIIRDNIPYDDQQVMNAMYEGIRLAQDLCYCRDWSLYTPIDVKPDPFQRDKKKVTQTLTDYVLQEQNNGIQSAQEILNMYWSTPPQVPQGAAAAPTPTPNTQPVDVWTLQTSPEEDDEDNDEYAEDDIYWGEPDEIEEVPY